GGTFGKGPGNSTQRNFLPSPYADFIYAVIIEEYGLLIGGVGVIVLYLIFLYRSVKIVVKSPKAFGALLAAALSFSLVIQAFANMAVATNLFPVTRVSLPLVRMGGTSILFPSLAFGIILSVSRDVEEVDNQQTGRSETQEGHTGDYERRRRGRTRVPRTGHCRCAQRAGTCGGAAFCRRERAN